jgi:hypothetical protein
VVSNIPDEVERDNGLSTCSITPVGKRCIRLRVNGVLRLRLISPYSYTTSVADGAASQALLGMYPLDFATHVAGMMGNIPDEVERDNGLSTCSITLLKAARRLVQQGGFAATSASAVAKKSEVTSGTIYRHFPNKSELVAEVFRYATEREVAADKLTAAVETFAHRALLGRTLAYTLITEPVDPRASKSVCVIVLLTLKFLKM